jgi:hypothetical protein
VAAAGVGSESESALRQSHGGGVGDELGVRMIVGRIEETAKCVS